HQLGVERAALAEVAVEVDGHGLSPLIRQGSSHGLLGAGRTAFPSRPPLLDGLGKPSYWTLHRIMPLIPPRPAGCLPGKGEQTRRPSERQVGYVGQFYVPG